MGSKELDKNLIKFAKGLKKPVLEYIGKDEGTRTNTLSSTIHSEYNNSLQGTIEGMHRMTRSGWILLLLMMLAAAACRKPTLIGDDLIPPDDYLYSERQDTFSVFTTVLRDDSVVTSNNLFFPLEVWTKKK
ncbi:MAG: hypothetical protein H6546_05605 [Chitinophagales bacterium]|nr:hypothetical protein [Chitinophagales bacterium]